MKKIVFIIFILVPVVFSGCATTTSYSTNVLPDADDKLGGTGIEAVDVRTTARKMAVSILNVPEISQVSEGIPRIALLPVKNNSRFMVDKDILTKKIRIELNKNSLGKVRFLARDRMDDILKERDLKRDGLVTTSKDASLIGVDYFFSGEISGIAKAAGSDRSDYIILSFQLIDAETSEIIWEDSYEFKKVGITGVVYQ